MRSEKDALEAAGMQNHEDMYYKGAEGSFNGMIFVKFASAVMRDHAVKISNAMKINFMDKKVFMRPEFLMEVRMQRRALLGLKNLPVERQFPEGSVYVDTGNFTLLVDDVLVLKVSVQNFKLSMEWMDERWRTWPDLHDHHEFQVLVESTEEKLAAAQVRKSKAKGKMSQGETA